MLDSEHYPWNLDWSIMWFGKCLILIIPPLFLIEIKQFQKQKYRYFNYNSANKDFKGIVVKGYLKLRFKRFYLSFWAVLTPCTMYVYRAAAVFTPCTTYVHVPLKENRDGGGNIRGCLILNPSDISFKFFKYFPISILLFW